MTTLTRRCGMTYCMGKWCFGDDTNIIRREIAYNIMVSLEMLPRMNTGSLASHNGLAATIALQSEESEFYAWASAWLTKRG